MDPLIIPISDKIPDLHKTHTNCFVRIFSCSRVAEDWEAPQILARLLKNDIPDDYRPRRPQYRRHARSRQRHTNDEWCSSAPSQVSEKKTELTFISSEFEKYYVAIYSSCPLNSNWNFQAHQMATCSPFPNSGRRREDVVEWNLPDFQRRPRHADVDRRRTRRHLVGRPNPPETSSGWVIIMYFSC